MDFSDLDVTARMTLNAYVKPKVSSSNKTKNNRAKSRNIISNDSIIFYL